jgi:hypothetical protein
MEYTSLESSCLKVSPITLGSTTWSSAAKSRRCSPLEDQSVGSLPCEPTHFQKARGADRAPHARFARNRERTQPWPIGPLIN